MMCVIEPLYETPKKQQPRLFVGNNSDTIYVSLDTSSFKIEFEDGKASVRLSTNLSLKDARKMAQAIIEECDKREEYLSGLSSHND